MSVFFVDCLFFVLFVGVAFLVAFRLWSLSERKKQVLAWEQKVLVHHWDSPDVEPFMAGGCPQCGKRPE